MVQKRLAKIASKKIHLYISKVSDENVNKQILEVDSDQLGVFELFMNISATAGKEYEFEILKPKTNVKLSINEIMDSFPNEKRGTIKLLFNDFKDVVLVDTRSQREYETLRIKGAVNIPVTSKEFDDRIKLLRASTKKPIVFYTSRQTCNKSYLAGRKANHLNIEDTYAYDAGVYDWAKTHPNHVILLGKKSDDVPADIIPPKKIQISFVGP